MVTGHRRRRFVRGAEGRDAATADQSFAELGEERRQQLAAISLDMGPGYAKSGRTHAERAAIAIDPFRVAKAGSDAFDDVRRGYWNELGAIGDTDAARRFKDARSLLKRPENFTDRRGATLARLPPPAASSGAYTLKEALFARFSRPD